MIFCLLNVYKNHVEKTFDFDSDFEKFGENIDKSQRMRFTVPLTVIRDSMVTVLFL